MKKIISIILVLVLAFAVAVPAAAATTDQMLFDNAAVLQQTDADLLQQELKNLHNENNFDLYLITVQGTQGVELNDYVNNFCTEYNIQENEAGGMISILDIENDKHLFYAFGYAEDVFTTDITDLMSQNLSDFYTAQDYYGLHNQIISDVKTNLAENSNTATTGSVAIEEKSSVVDMEDLITDDEEDLLTQKINGIRDEFNYDVVIVTTPGTGNKTVVEYADDFYDYNGYGCGEENDGMLFLISMAERDYYTSTTGYGITVFTDYGIEKIGGEVQPLLTDGEYYAAFDKYLDLVNEYLTQARKGVPYDVDNTFKTASDYVEIEVIIVGISFVIAIIAIVIMCAKMNTAIKQSRAANYVKNGSFRLTNQNDMFLYSHVSRTKIETESSGGGGGSSVHFGSSGVSHGGGGGKF